MSDFIESTGTLTLGGKTYAVGLLWNTASGGGKIARNEAKLTAKLENINADFYCIRGTATPQYGLGLKSDDHKSGMPSLAALFSDIIPESWIGVFPHNGGYYFIAARDEGILPKCDEFIIDEDVAREKFTEKYEDAEWSRIYCPADWDIEPPTRKGSVFKNISLEEFFDEEIVAIKKTKLTTLTSVDNTKRNKIIIYGVLLVFSLGLFFYALGDMFFEEEVVPVQLTNVQKKPEKPPFIPEWRNKPLPASMITSCMETSKNVKLYPPGWLFEGFTCNETGLVASYSKSGGTVKWITDYMKPSSVSFVQEKALVNHKYSKALDIRKDERTIGTKQADMFLSSYFQEYFQRYKTDPGPNSAEFTSIMFGVRGVISPENFASTLNSVPALVLSKITFNFSLNEWIIEGKIYEKLPDVITK